MNDPYWHTDARSNAKIEKKIRPIRIELRKTANKTGKTRSFEQWKGAIVLSEWSCIQWNKKELTRTSSKNNQATRRSARKGARGNSAEKSGKQGKQTSCWHDAAEEVRKCATWTWIRTEHAGKHKQSATQQKTQHAIEQVHNHKSQTSETQHYGVCKSKWHTRSTAHCSLVGPLLHAKRRLACCAIVNQCDGRKVTPHDTITRCKVLLLHRLGGVFCTGYCELSALSLSLADCDFSLSQRWKQCLASCSLY